MTKLTLNDVGNLNVAGLTTINDNSDKIVAAIDNTLSRDGTSPNQMAADFDMNHNDIINVDNLNMTGSLVIDGVTVIPEEVAIENMVLITDTDASGFDFVAGIDDTPADKSKVLPTVERVEDYAMSKAVYDPNSVADDVFDSGNQVFAQVETDHRVWDLKTRGQEVIMAADFWAVGENDFGPALTRIAAIDDDNIAIVLPRAPMPLNTEVTFTDKDLSLVGRGRAGSKILIGDVAGTIKFLDTTTTANSDSHRLTVENMLVTTNVVSAAGSGPIAFQPTWSYTGSAGCERALFKDIEIVSGGSGKWFKSGIRIVDGCRIDFEGVKIFNEDGHQTCLSPAAIEIVRLNASNLTGFNFTDCKLNRYVNGLLLSQEDANLDGTFEGFMIKGGEFVNVAYAIHEDNVSSTSRYFDSISLTNLHWNASRAGFKTGQTRGLSVTGCHLFHDNFGESGQAPLEAAFNFGLYAQAVVVSNNPNTARNATTGHTDDAPAFLLPTDANINWVNLGDNNMYANWSSGLVVQDGTQSTTSAKLRLGNNILVSTSRTAGTGFFGRVVGANPTVSDGDTITFPHKFSGAPAVSVCSRSATNVNVWADAVTATGFTVHHDKGSAATIAWTAVGD